MPDNNTAHRNDFAVESRLGPRTRDAIVAAAASMALADGRVEAVEHRSLLTFLRQQGMLLAFGRADIRQRYVTEIGRSSGEDDLLDRLRPLAGMEVARLVVTVAACVAAADGVVHPAEIQLLRSVRGALGLVQGTQA